MNFKIQDPRLTFPRTRSRRTRTDSIAIHHFAGVMTVQEVHNSHSSAPRNWNGIGYNVVVDLDGTIWLGRGLEFSGAHTENFNSTTIGIGVNGNYHTTREMPDAQYNALVWLIKHLRGIYGDIPVRGHNEFAGHTSNACPGQFFPLAEVKRLQFRGKVGETGAVETIFNDTNGHWAEQTINELFEMGIVNGGGDGNFRPNDTATRAEVAAMIRNVVRFVTGK